MSTPIFVALRKKYPNSKIYVLLGKNNAEVEPLLPIDCYVRVYEKNLLKDMKMLRELRSEKIDIAIDLTDNASVTSSILLSKIGAKLNIGFEKENGSVYDITVPTMDKASVPISVRIAQLLRPFGIGPETVDLRPSLNLPVARIRGRVGFNVSSRTPERCAPPTACAEIAKGVLDMGFHEIVVFAAPKDMDRGTETVRLAADPRVHLADKAKTFAQFAEQISTCDYFITVDTSAIQIAAACGIPMMLLFRPMPGEHPWTPQGVPFEIHTQFPSLASLESQPVLALFRQLIDRVGAEHPTTPFIYADKTL